MGLSTGTTGPERRSHRLQRDVTLYSGQNSAAFLGPVG